ncbi:unnamed protein product [Amoebophrya sp. A120]|nr:unnamed protein product [Amoebophrya sp. A120]|eukprot:GSA120T00015387001.1
MRAISPALLSSSLSLLLLFSFYLGILPSSSGEAARSCAILWQTDEAARASTLAAEAEQCVLESFSRFPDKVRSYARFFRCGGCNVEFDYGNCIVARDDQVTEFAGLSSRSLNWRQVSSRDEAEIRAKLDLPAEAGEQMGGEHPKHLPNERPGAATSSGGSVTTISQDDTLSNLFDSAAAELLELDAPILARDQAEDKRTAKFAHDVVSRFLYQAAEEGGAMQACAYLCCGGDQWLFDREKKPPSHVLHRPARAEERGFSLSGQEPCHVDAESRHTCLHRNVCLVPDRNYFLLPDAVFAFGTEAEAGDRAPRRDDANHFDAIVDEPLMGCPGFTYGQPPALELWHSLYSFDFPCGFQWPGTLRDFADVYGMRIRGSLFPPRSELVRSHGGDEKRRKHETLASPSSSTPTSTADLHEAANVIQGFSLIVGLPNTVPPTIWHFVQHCFGLVGAKVLYRVQRWESVLVSDPGGWLNHPTSQISRFFRRVFELLVGQRLGSAIELPGGLKYLGNDHYSENAVGVPTAEEDGEMAKEHTSNEEAPVGAPSPTPSENFSHSSGIAITPREDRQQELATAADRDAELTSVFKISAAKITGGGGDEATRDAAALRCHEKAVFSGWTATGVSGTREMTYFREHVRRLYPNIQQRRSHVLYLSRNPGMVAKVLEKMKERSTQSRTRAMNTVAAERKQEDIGWWTAGQQNTITSGEMEHSKNQTSTRRKEINNFPTESRLLSNVGRSIWNEREVVVALQRRIWRFHRESRWIARASPDLQIHTGAEPFETQLQLFAGAALVVGTFASGLSNLIFLPKNAHLLVLTPRGNMHSQQDLATNAGFFYHKFFLRDSLTRCMDGGNPAFDRFPASDPIKFHLGVPAWRVQFPLQNVSAGHLASVKGPSAHLLWRCSFGVDLDRFLPEFETIFGEAFSFVQRRNLNANRARDVERFHMNQDQDAYFYRERSLRVLEVDRNFSSDPSLHSPSDEEEEASSFFLYAGFVRERKSPLNHDSGHLRKETQKQLGARVQSRNEAARAVLPIFTFLLLIPSIPAFRLCL